MAGISTFTGLPRSSVVFWSAFTVVGKKSLAFRHQPVDARFNILEHEVAAAIGTLGFASGSFQVQQRNRCARNRPAVLDVNDAAFNYSGRRVFWRSLSRERRRQRQSDKNRS